MITSEINFKLYRNKMLIIIYDKNDLKYNLKNEYYIILSFRKQKYNSTRSHTTMNCSTL